MTTPIVIVAIVALLVLMVAASTVRIAKEYDLVNAPTGRCPPG